jgi:ribonucleoside-diphosphate reductase alpha chain
MSERKRLPDRRANTTFQFQCAGLRYTCSYSRFADDCRVAELFLSNTKSTSQSDSNARDAAVAASLALQHGCALATLRGAILRNADGNASTPLGTAIDIITQLEAGS